jgi:hypothetical protein
MAEQLLGGVGVDVGNGNPLSVGIPKASRDKAVSVGGRLQERAKGLRDTNDAGSSVFIARGFAHELLDGLIGESCEIGEQLAVSHEERPQHFGQGESPQAVADVFEQLILEKGGESGRPLRIA